MVKEKKPNIVFLMETKCRNAKMEGIRVKLDFVGLFVVDPIGRSGGLALLWKEKNVLDIQNYFRWHINAVVANVEGSFMEVFKVLWPTGLDEEKGVVGTLKIFKIFLAWTVDVLW